ncbi:amidase signature domain-containing protein [Roridomyces roridus]|uniref:Amidase signature domain-containing protein n=1 Tax=Roridomyces roridus TaxID=1738132 RepID=A0AAD7CJ70_9AGAR|nr:amidase signature domain-containing protein [Roridomyces roridus]
MSVVKLSDKVSVSASDVQEAAGHLGIAVPETDLEAYRVLLSSLDDCAETIRAEDDYLPHLDLERFPRVNIHKPTQNDYNAWAYKVQIQSTAPEDMAGVLAGRTIAVKDNVNIAGVPSLLGTDVLSTPYVPKYDATIVTRMLQAGASIEGKSACENFSISPHSFTNAQANVLHPMAPGYSIGGSSSGSAALLCADKIDLAIGGDQGGSIRLPASFGGIVGFKPTWGLVPYTGIASLTALVDHTGPMTKNVLDNALLLTVLAGRDGLDDRQIDAPAHGAFDYYKDLLAFQGNPKESVKGMRIAILRESMQVEGLDPRVHDKIKHAASLFSTLGAEVTEVSIPMHKLGPIIWTVANRQGISEQALRAQNPVRFGVHDVEMNQELFTWTQEKFEKLQLHNPSATNSLLGGEYLKHQHPGMTDKAINLSRKLKDTYESVLKEQKIDLLIAPCTPTISIYGPDLHDSIMTKMNKAIGITQNTAPFNVSGHPALCLPIGMLGIIEREKDSHIKLPIGMQIVGGLWQEAKVLRAAYAWEKSYNWRDM